MPVEQEGEKIKRRTASEVFAQKLISKIKKEIEVLEEDHAIRVKSKQDMIDTILEEIN